MMLGNSVNEEVFQERTEEEDNAATAIHVKLLIEDCKKLLIPDPEVILGSWGLIDADPVYVRHSSFFSLFFLIYAMHKNNFLLQFFFLF